jgi:hypothetical protein
MLTVHVRINDSSTGKPTPVRLRITDGAGVYHPPLGRQVHFATAEGADRAKKSRSNRDQGDCGWRRVSARLGQAAADVDVVIDYLWGTPAERAMAALDRALAEP